MENIFDHYDLLEVMEGTEKRPENDPEKSPWVRKSAQGYLLLGQALGSSQIRHIKPFQREPEKGPKAWAALKGVHAPATAAVAVVLERQMAALRIEEDEAVEEGVQKLFDLLTRLEGADLNYMEAAGVVDMAATTRATDAVAADSMASATIVTRADICGAIASRSLMDGPLLKAKRVEEQEEGEEEAVEAVEVAEVVLQFRDPSWLGTVWHCSTSLYLGSWGAPVAARAGGTGVTAATGPGGARPSGAGAAGTRGVGCPGVGDPTEPGAAGAGVAGVGGPGAGGVRAARARVGGTGAGGTRAAGAGAVLGVPSSTGFPPPFLCPPPDQSQPPLQPASPLPAPSPYTEQSGGLTERSEPVSRPVSPVRSSRRAPRSRPSLVPGTHIMALRPSSVLLRVPLPAPPESSLLEVPDPASDHALDASPTVARLLATAITDPSIESAAASALIHELLDFDAACRLDYASALVAESVHASPPSVGGECVLGTNVLEDKQEDYECLTAAVPRFASMLLAPEGDPDAPDIPTPRFYAEAITGPYSSQWQAAMDAEMASWKSTGTYGEEFPPSRANIVDGMWIFRRDYELYSLDFSTTFMQGSLHEKIRLLRPPVFTGTFPAGSQWSLRRPVYGLRHALRVWHDTLRTTLADLGFAPSTADPSLFLRTDTSLPPFYALMYVDDLVFATGDTEAPTLVKSELQKRHTCTDLAPPWDESVELSGPYPELVGCLMYLMTCTRPDLAYPLSLLARYVAPGRHRKVHWDAAKRALRYLCSTSGVGLVLGGQGPVVLTGHRDASLVDDSATQRSSQGYTFSLASSSVSWWYTRSSSILSSSCEAEIYAGAMAAQELRWLTYLLTDLGERSRSPPVLHIDNKAMIALCQEHRTKHIALRYFLARELQQRGQLRVVYVATRANTADVFTKALPPGDHQRFATVLGLVPTLPHLLSA
ncbi:unnamed protein product [Closterium sp. NIES-53]